MDAVEELNVYATFYPLYAIAEMILEDVPDARLNCLVQPQDGVAMRSPTGILRCSAAPRTR